ncbi:MAG: hypothetical protein IJK84_03590 [Bacteroidales bacterium]|nr:hypothetical protein [Bacteroidales bacterium]
MKKFLINIAVFLIVVALLGYMLDCAITHGLHKRTDYVQEVWNDVYDTTVNPDLVVLGNCVAAHDHNPRILDSVLGSDSYVFAMSNLTFPYHNFMWNMLKKQQKKNPKLVVLALDYSDMCCREAKTNMENEQFLALMHDSDARHFLMRYGGYSWLDAYVPCYRYFGHHKRIRYGIFNFLGMKKYAGSPEHYKGYQGLDEPYNAHREWFDGSFEQPIEPEVVTMLDDFMKQCKQSGTELLLVLPPIVYELSDRVENEEEVYAVYDSLADKYGYECIRYVAPHWMSMDTNHFESPNHLNKRMSDVYTRDLAKYIADHNLYKK